MKVEVDVLGSPSLIVLMVSVNAKQHQRTELRSCVKVEVAVRGSPSLIVHSYGLYGRKVSQDLITGRRALTYS